MLCYHFSANIYKTYYQMSNWGFDFGHFRSKGGGTKIKRLFEKMSKLSYKLKSIVLKWFKKVIYST